MMPQRRRALPRARLARTLRWRVAPRASPMPDPAMTDSAPPPESPDLPEIILSVIVRMAYLAFVGVWAAVMALVPAFGFSGGANPVAYALLALYLVTFGPAVCLAFLPWSRIRRPGLSWKLWYAWMAVVLLAAPAYKAIHGSRLFH
jgi:hypothetical protein